MHYYVHMNHMNQILCIITCTLIKFQPIAEFDVKQFYAFLLKAECKSQFCSKSINHSVGLYGIFYVITYESEVISGKRYTYAVL